MDDGLWMIDVIGLGTVCFLLVKFVVFTNISSCLLASIHVDCRLHMRGWWRPYARMDANKHIKRRLKQGKDLFYKLSERAINQRRNRKICNNPCHSWAI